jgi:hypothetical protein
MYQEIINNINFETYQNKENPFESSFLETNTPKRNYYCTDEKYTGQYSLSETRVGINVEFFGSGKTQKAINHYKETKQNIIIVNPTRSLINDVSNRFQKENIPMKSHLYLNKLKQLGNYSGCINTTLESMIHIDFQLHRDTIFIFDEFSTILNQCFSSINNSRRDRMLQALKRIFTHHKVEVFDALLNESDYNLICDLVGRKDEISVISNRNYMPPRREIYNYNSLGTVQEKIKSLLKNPSENVLVLCDVVKESNVILSMLDYLNDSEKINLCRDTRESLLSAQTIDKLVQDNKPRILAISPTGFVGLNISTRHFTHVILIAMNKAIKDYRLYIQAIHRERDYSIPLHIYSQREDEILSIKKTTESILEETNRRERALNMLFPAIISKEGIWETREDYKPFKTYIAENRALYEINRKTGVANYIISYYSSFKQEDGLQWYFVNHVDKQTDRFKPPAGVIETKEEKKERLKKIELIDKEVYENLKIERSERDLTKEEESLMAKFELSEKLNIDYTSLDRQDKINAVYDFTVNSNHINKIANRILAFTTPDNELYVNEKIDNELKGVSLNPSSMLLEKVLVKNVLKEFKDREFTKLDLTDSLIQNLSLATGKDFGLRWNEKFLKTSTYKEILSKTGGLSSLALDYAKEIAGGNNATIMTVYKYEFDLVKTKEITRWNKSHGTNYNVNGFPKSKKLGKLIIEKQSKFLKKIQAKYIVSNVDALSDVLINWGIKIEQVSKSGDIRKYKLNTTLLETFVII